jgi:hypothetical protein
MPLLEEEDRGDDKGQDPEIDLTVMKGRLEGFAHGGRDEEEKEQGWPVPLGRPDDPHDKPKAQESQDDV